MKALTAREAWDLMKTRVSPATRTAIEGMIAAGRVTLDETKKPDAIIGGSGPSDIVGSERVKCRDCGRALWLSPRSGAATLARWPETPVLCVACAVAKVDS